MSSLPTTTSLLIATCLAASVRAEPPEPVYWRQNLFSVPYEWSSSDAAGAAQSVSLFVSKDRGATWQQVRDAEPQLLAFNYRADADGEYWFAIRTMGAGSRDASAESASALQPELRVIVDTTMPRFENLTGIMHDDTALEIRWRVADANLQAHSCQLEWQRDAASQWQPVPLTGASEAGPGVWDGMATVPLATGPQPIAVRATVVDLAGNRAVFQSLVARASAVGAPTRTGSANGPSRLPPAATVVAAPGWTSNSTPSVATVISNQFAEPQVWPPDRSTGPDFPIAGSSPPSVTYGTPLTSSEATLIGPPAEADLRIPTPQPDDRPLGNVPRPRRPPVVPLEPFRQVSISREVPPADAAPPADADHAVRLVNSRTFALEYELAETGAEGVSKVELWGTRDGGQTWQSYAVDPDNRSPMTVTVDGAGEYGFRIVVEGVDDVGDFPPQPGDRPELWVGVDLEPPQAQLLSADIDIRDRGRSLVLRWDADDDNLEPRPIALFYSSRRAGPWTAIATSVENVGEFAWPLQRHVPRRIFLKLEARDTAGNVAVYQTSEAVAIEEEPPAARVQRLPPLDNSAQLP